MENNELHSCPDTGVIRDWQNIHETSKSFKPGSERERSYSFLSESLIRKYNQLSQWEIVSAEQDSGVKKYLMHIGTFFEFF